MDIPEKFPETGCGEKVAFNTFRDLVETKSAILDSETMFAHMDPPTPEIAFRLAGLNARFNQNLLHPDLSPFATEAEERVINWLCPAFGMSTGHMCGGSTLANLTALWCAREAGGKRVVASDDAHISIAKSAHILGLPLDTIGVDQSGRMDCSMVADLSDSVLVLTAGTTGRGVVDPLIQTGALWTHVDAAWAGPLRFSRYSHLLDGIDNANSISISAHKWLYQPKESALVLFSDPSVEELISFGGSYLSTPNIGVQGSRGASAIPLLATLYAWGREGLASRLEKNMADAEKLADLIDSDNRLELKQQPETAVINWRPVDRPVESVIERLSKISSRTSIDGETWIRQVAVNPEARIFRIWESICSAL
jgi:glutamate/tyrosine decarboxylase-like PLP-dependent enzyme